MRHWEIWTFQSHHLGDRSVVDIFLHAKGIEKSHFMFFLGYSLMDLSLYRIWTIWTFLGCAA